MTRLRLAGNRAVRALRVRNFRLYLLGQVVSVSGTWMQWVAQDWLVLRLSGSGVAVGVNTGLQFLPVLLVGLYGGVLADRFDKRRLLMWSQSVMALLALTLGVLTATGTVALWSVFLLAFLTGCASAVDTPARQSFVPEMVGPEHTANAVALNAAAFNAGRLVGPALAGVLIATTGLAVAFFANAASFVAVLGALAVMDPGRLHRSGPAERSAGQVREGLRYVRSTPELWRTLLLVAVVATFGLNLRTILPLLTRFTFHAGPEAFGLLTSVVAAGALVGALAAAARGRPSTGLLVGSASVFGALVVAAALMPTLTSTAVVLVPVGAAGIAFMSTANATLQLHSDPRMRGRVMSVYTVVFLGSTPLGGPLMGWVSQQWGAPVALHLAGGLTLLAAAVAGLSARRRHAAATAAPGGPGSAEAAEAAVAAA